MRSLSILVLFSWVMCCGAQVSLTGMVVDGAGQGVAGVKVFSQGSVGPASATPEPLGDLYAVTDASGHFSFAKYSDFGGIALLAVAPGGSQAALTVVAPKDSGTALRVVLGPTHAVSMTVVAPGEASEKERISRVYAGTTLPLIAVFGRRTTLRLPEGMYSLLARAQDTAIASEEFQVGPGDVRLPALRLRLTAMAASYGGASPALAGLVDLENRDFEVKPEKGVWTLLYFWEEGCFPCIHEGFPKLMAFQRAHARDRKRFRLIGVHTYEQRYTASTTRDYVRKLEAELWHESPTFAMLYDASGKTTAAWEIEEWPTYGLIDPAGKLVRGDLSTLEKALQE